MKRSRHSEFEDRLRQQEETLFGNIDFSTQLSILETSIGEEDIVTGYKKGQRISVTVNTCVNNETLHKIRQEYVQNILDGNEDLNKLFERDFFLDCRTLKKKMYIDLPKLTEKDLLGNSDFDDLQELSH